MKIKLLITGVILCLISCGNPVPRKPVVRKTSSFMKESVLYNKSLNEAEENAFEALMKNDSLHEYKTSPSGFWYALTKKSNNSYFPKFGDKVQYSYQVYTINNELIYDFNDIGTKTYVVDQQEIEEGLRNGLKLMNEGDEATFLFPSHKMYGYVGDDNKIDINQPLIYKVKLNKIN